MLFHLRLHPQYDLMHQLTCFAIAGGNYVILSTDQRCGSRHGAKQDIAIVWQTDVPGRHAPARLPDFNRHPDRGNILSGRKCHADDVVRCNRPVGRVPYAFRQSGYGDAAVAVRTDGVEHCLASQVADMGICISMAGMVRDARCRVSPGRHMHMGWCRFDWHVARSGCGGCQC